MDSSRTLVYWCFLILGISSLLPWNLYMTAHQYFSYKLRNTTTWPSNSSSAPIGNYSLTPLQRTFETYLTASGSAISIVGAVGNTLLTSKLTNGVRVSVGHLFVFLPLLPTIALAWINTDEEQVGFFVATLLLGNIANLAANGFIGGGAMGLAARF
uniref:Uncharacterized protein n=1 Tax=Plectus sambesii TaxID=2011161 RepID=A0A914UUF2_9BILA